MNKALYWLSYIFNIFFITGRARNIDQQQCKFLNILQTLYDVTRALFCLAFVLKPYINLIQFNIFEVTGEVLRV